ncbi:hypothetical protein HDG34_000706 [Paraburkholderia sp. HC6.4b]|nr:hypothetical protein [Paraburkholderia sp. HC6.4b]MBB5449146.1 hypothetical protein [Paraburkholderia sp. Kb1A]MBB5459830.1 hypothetical protein [Paraburkholderia sp. Cpub6]
MTRWIREYVPNLPARCRAGFFPSALHGRTSIRSADEQFAHYRANSKPVPQTAPVRAVEEG